MLKHANNVAKRLWQDESGVVLAVTVIVFLTLFLMACAVFAIGETVRQRIEIQNGADAAAYSAAVVQADCISRVAAINRAMAWTYVQMVRMEMDYIVDKWLWLTLDRWNKDNDRMKQFNQMGTCNIGLPFYATGKGREHKMILLNKQHLVSTDQIDAARQQAAGEDKSYQSLTGPIDDCREAIEAMNEKEKELIRKLPKRLKATVEAILKENLADTWNDGFAGGSQLMYALLQEEQPLDKNFRVLELKEEDDFLRHADYTKGAKQTFEAGTDVWFVKQYADEGPGLQRQYKRDHPILISEWDWWSSKWREVDGACVMYDETSGSSSVKGDDDEIYDENYYITALAQPQVLREEFFAKGGSLIVGATRRLNNPLQFMTGDGPLGIIKPFTLDDGNRYMWTASAAIAGYNPKPPEDCKGSYEVTYEDNSGDKLWNLKTSDWDANLIPLHRAWAKGKDRSWQGETAGQILEEVKGKWEPLYSGGGALGAQGAPKGMNAGAEINYGGAEGWVVH